MFASGRRNFAGKIEKISLLVEREKEMVGTMGCDCIYEDVILVDTFTSQIFRSLVHYCSVVW